MAAPICVSDGLASPEGSVFRYLLQRLEEEHERELAALRLAVMQQNQDITQCDAPRSDPRKNVTLRAAAQQPEESSHFSSISNRKRLTTWNKESAPRATVAYGRSTEKKSNHLLQSELSKIKGWHGPRLSISSEEGITIGGTWTSQIHQVFYMLCNLAIILNVTFLGIVVDMSAREEKLQDELPSVVMVIDRMFVGWFVFELIVRLSVRRLRFFMDVNRWWNLFDFIVVFTDVVSAALDLFLQSSSGSMENATSLRVLRVLRITRALRIVRTLHFFEDLRLMVASMLRCMQSLLWPMVILFFITYIFGVYLVYSVAGHVATFVGDKSEDDDYIALRAHWDSLLRGQYTLFACMSGGYSWADVSRPLISIHWSYGLVLCFFVFFTVFGVMNIITGIFVDKAIVVATVDREQVIQEHLSQRDSELMTMKQIFDEADTDQSGSISWDEFENHLGDPRVRAHLRSLGLEFEEARALFQLLDIDKSGDIAIDEFVFGLLRLKGGAKSVDLATLMYENKRIAAEINKLACFCKAKFELLQVEVAYVERQLEPNSRLAVPLQHATHNGTKLSL